LYRIFNSKTFFRSNFPDHEFIGEEDISDGSGQVSSFSEKPTWIIDPIDGTMNFVHSNPLVTISVALAINRRLVLGIISAPCIGKLYAARKNHGATLNGKPIKVSNCEKLNLAQCILEFWSCSGKDHEEKQLYNAKQLISKVHSLRSIGSACLNLAFIAAGNSDIYCQAGIHCWDVAAGAVIVSEAGGIVLDPSGQEFDIMSRRILVASTQKLVDEWKNQIDYQTPKFERDFPEICPM